MEIRKNNFFKNLKNILTTFVVFIFFGINVYGWSIIPEVNDQGQSTVVKVEGGKVTLYPTAPMSSGESWNLFSELDTFGGGGLVEKVVINTIAPGEGSMGGGEVNPNLREGDVIKQVILFVPEAVVKLGVRFEVLGAKVQLRVIAREGVEVDGGVFDGVSGLELSTVDMYGENGTVVLEARQGFVNVGGEGLRTDGGLILEAERMVIDGGVEALNGRVELLVSDYMGTAGEPLRIGGNGYLWGEEVYLKNGGTREVKVIGGETGVPVIWGQYGDVKIEARGGIDFGDRLIKSEGDMRIESGVIGGSVGIEAGLGLSVEGTGKIEGGDWSAGSWVDIKAGGDIKLGDCRGGQEISVKTPGRFEGKEVRYVTRGIFDVHGINIERLNTVGVIIVRKYCGEVVDVNDEACKGVRLELNGSNLGFLEDGVTLDFSGDEWKWDRKDGVSLKTVNLEVSGACKVTSQSKFTVNGGVSGHCIGGFLNNGVSEVRGVMGMVLGGFTNQALFKSVRWKEKNFEAMEKKGIQVCWWGRLWHGTQTRFCNKYGDFYWTWLDFADRFYENMLKDTGIFRVNNIQFNIINGGDFNNTHGGDFEITGRGASTINIEGVEGEGKGSVINEVARMSTQEGEDKNGWRFYPSSIRTNGDLNLRVPQNGTILNKGSNIDIGGDLNIESACNVTQEDVNESWVYWKAKHYDDGFIEKSATESIKTTNQPSMLYVHGGINRQVGGRVMETGSYVFSRGGIKDKARYNIETRGVAVPKWIEDRNRMDFRNFIANSDVRMGISSEKSDGLMARVDNLVAENKAPMGISGGVMASLGNITQESKEGRVIYKDGATAIAPKITLTGQDGALVEGYVGKYISKEEHHKRSSVREESGYGRPAMLVSFEYPLEIDGGEGVVELNGAILYSGGKAKIKGRKIEVLPVSMQLEREYWERKRKIFSKTDIYTKQTFEFVLPTLFLTPEGLEMTAEESIHLQGAQIYTNPEAGAELYAKDVILEAKVAANKLERRVKTRGFAFPGLTGALVEAFEGKSFGGALVNNVGILNALKGIAEMESVTDLSPAMKAAMEIYSLSEKYGKAWEANGGDVKGALGTTLMGQLGFTKMGAFWAPSGIGMYKKELNEKSVGYDAYELEMRIGTLRVFSENLTMMGVKGKIEHNLELNIKDTLKLLALKTATSNTKEWSGTQFGIGCDDSFMTFSMSAQEGETRVEALEYVLGAGLEVGGKVILDVGGDAEIEVPLEADFIGGRINGTAVFRTMQDHIKQYTDMGSYGIGARIGSGGFYPSINLGMTHGRGATDWAKEQLVWKARDSMDLTFDGLDLQGASLEAPAGEIRAREFRYSDILNTHYYDQSSYGFSLDVGEFLRSMTAVGENAVKGAGSALLGFVDFGYKDESKEEILRATVAPGITIETQSDLEGLNRDLAKRRELLYEKKAAYSLAMPIVDFQKLKENVALIGEAIEDAKGQFKAYFAKAREVVKGDERAVLQVKYLENAFEKAVEVIEKSELPNEKKQELFVEVTQAIQDPNIQRYVQVQETTHEVLKGKDIEDATIEEYTEIHYRIEPVLEFELDDITILSPEEALRQQIYSEAYLQASLSANGNIESFKQHMQGLTFTEKMVTALKLAELLESTDTSLTVDPEIHKGRLEGLSLKIDFTRYLSMLKSAIEVYKGKDLITEEPINRYLVGAAVIVGVATKGKVCITENVKAIGKGAAKVAPHADEVFKVSKKIWGPHKEFVEKVMFHNKFGKFYKVKGENQWWARDLANHAECEWKVFRKTGKGLEWIEDADKTGRFLKNKHKSEMGRIIPWKELNGR